MSFQRNSPVLSFRLRAHQKTLRKQRRYLLWPVWVYQVCAPQIRQRRLNILQKAALGLCDAGLFELQRLAKTLDIHPNLAGEIVHELQQDGLLDERGLPTATGKNYLHEETLNIEEKLQVGFVFQDALTQTLWSRFEPNLNHAKVEYDEKGFPGLLEGDKGKPFVQWAYQIPATSKMLPTQPSPKQILEALQQQMRAQKQTSSWAVDEEDFTSYAERELENYLQRVSLIETDPKPMFITTYAYALEEERDWYVCDPFGFGPSLQLRNALEQQMTTGSGEFLRKQIHSLLEYVLAEGFEDLEAWQGQLQQKAKLEIPAELRQSIIYQPLLDMETAWQEAAALGEKCSRQKLNVIPGLMRKVQEALFGDILKKWPGEGTWRQLPKNDKIQLHQIYKDAAKKIGFNRIPDPLANVPPNLIRSVTDFPDNWRLRPLISASILIANNQPEHPLYQAAEQQPDLLDILEELVKAGGKSTHHKIEQESVSINKVGELRKTLYAVTAILTA
ncbi:hypothetical protein [Candidatus Venteria ishoeyi]|uniref:Uncharacterized protein n=1 Tax=Candidatus Venteria ishoeyi TaxID=1899563 RepID=A0A1H6FAZ2_9GAMM|nr:hypothetical protein [Candidatus Venteria ishoeyi]SEH06489.1 Uncharacterised protein [Candidatus Venteria ishoeyi]